MSDSTTPLQVEFGGQEGALTLEFTPGGSRGAGVRCTAIQLRLGALTGEVVTVLGLDAVRVRDEFASALASTDLTGTTHFSSVEGDLQVRVELHYGKGTIVAHVDSGFGLQDGYAEIRLSTDQTFLTTTARQLNELIGRFPMLADPKA